MTPTDQLGLEWAWNGQPFVVSGKSKRTAEATEDFFNAQGVYANLGVRNVNEDVLEACEFTSATTLEETAAANDSAAFESLSDAAGSVLSLLGESEAVITDMVTTPFISDADSSAVAADTSLGDVAVTLADAFEAATAAASERVIAELLESFGDFAIAPSISFTVNLAETVESTPTIALVARLFRSATDQARGSDAVFSAGSSYRPTAASLALAASLVQLHWDNTGTSTPVLATELDGLTEIRALVERLIVGESVNTAAVLGLSASTLARLGEILAVHWDMSAASAAELLTALVSTSDMRALVERLALSDLGASRAVLGLSATSSARLASMLANVWEMDAESVTQALAALSSVLDVRALVERVAVQALTATQGSLIGNATTAAQLADLLAVLWDMDGADAANFIPALALTMDTRALVERLVASESVTSQAVQSITAASLLRAIDTARVIWDALAADALVLADLAAADPLRVIEIVESLRLSGAAPTQLDASLIVAVAALFASLGETPIIEEIIEALATSETLSAKVLSNAALVESIILAHEIVTGRTLILAAESLPVMSSAVTPSQILSALATDAAGFGIDLLFGGEAFQGWAVRTDTLAATEYQNFPFNSMAKLGENYYGASDDGFYLLDGETDDGRPIEARIVTGELDFGTDALKRIERAYLGYTTSGDMVLKVIATHAGKKTEFWYRAPMLVRHEPTETRVPIGRGIVSRYLQFELVNIEGADFELDRMDLELLNLSRRV